MRLRSGGANPTVAALSSVTVPRKMKSDWATKLTSGSWKLFGVQDPGFTVTSGHRLPWGALPPAPPVLPVVPVLTVLLVLPVWAVPPVPPPPVPLFGADPPQPARRNASPQANEVLMTILLRR